VNSCCYYCLTLFFIAPLGAPRSSGPWPQFIDLSDPWFLCQWLGSVFFGSIPQCWLTWLVIAISKVDGGIYIYIFFNFTSWRLLCDIAMITVFEIFNTCNFLYAVIVLCRHWSQNFDIKKSQIWCISSFWQKFKQSVPRGLEELTCRTAF